MALIDFREIPEAHVFSGEQDSFELFAAEWLEMVGYEIIDRPGRGSDLGKDLIVAERRKGIGRETVVRWVVSCKHKAHSGKSVGVDDENNLMERVEGHTCRGFIGFYSTLASSSLIERLKQLDSRFEFQLIDRAAIERQLVSSGVAGVDVFSRYFPKSFSRWHVENPAPSNVFGENPRVLCEACGRDLLNPPQGVYVLWRTFVENDFKNVSYIDVHWSCKGECDAVVSKRIRDQHGDVLDSWDDIAELCIPVMYLRRVMAHLNALNDGRRWSPAAFDKFKTLLIAFFPHVCRQATTAERKRVVDLMDIPSYFGGAG